MGLYGHSERGTQESPVSCEPCIGPRGPAEMAGGAKMALGFSRAAGASRIHHLWGLVILVECCILQRGDVLHPWGPEHGGGKASASAEPQHVPVGEGTMMPREGGGEGAGRENSPELLAGRRAGSRRKDGGTTAVMGHRRAGDGFGAGGAPRPAITGRSGPRDAWRCATRRFLVSLAPKPTATARWDTLGGGEGWSPRSQPVPGRRQSSDSSLKR